MSKYKHIVILFLLLSTLCCSCVVAQQDVNKAFAKIIEKNLVYPKQKILENESAVVVLKFTKDSITVINSCSDDFRNAVDVAITKSRKQIDLNKISEPLLLPVLFIVVDDKAVGQERASMSIIGIYDLLRTLRENRKNNILESVVILGTKERRIND